MSRLLVPGRNCWRIERARRLAFLVDAADYFAAVRTAIAQAKRSVFILGWDFDSRIRLVPQGANDGYPEELGEFLKDVVKRAPALRMYVLSWDFAMLYAGDRQWLPLYKFGWKTHPAPRLAFHLDAKHPFSSSHHQKVVVVDDALAFCGGLDLTHGRWDTHEHRRDEPCRVDAQGRQSRPYHDVQAVVDGAAARALGALCRDRWRRAARERTPPIDDAPATDPWPRGLEPDVTDIDVAIARTDPGYDGGQAIREIRHLYVDAIASAKRSMYLENQYFSSSLVGAAIEERLQEADSPEVVVVSRLREEGWLEARTMGVLRGLLHRRLETADANGRYRLLYPHVPGLAGADLLNVHSKVIVVDDELASVGSANFNNRSMGFDTECNIAIEADGEPRIRRAIAGLRDRLVAEHLGTRREAVSAEMARHGTSLIATIEALRQPGGRTLEPLEPVVLPEMEPFLSVGMLVDPERPVGPDQLVEEFVPPDLRRPMAVRIVHYAAVLLVLLAVGAAWRWTPLGDWLSLRSIVSDAREHAHSLPAALAALAFYLVGGAITVPLTLLVTLTAIVFGPFLGFAYALAGAFLSAGATFAMGRLLGRDTVRRIAGARLNRITRRLASNGFLPIAALRLLPVAPFPVVNLVAGASRIRPREFFLGTALGIAPRIAVTILFVDRVDAALTDPGVFTIATLAAVTATIVAAAWYAWRRFGQR